MSLIGDIKRKFTTQSLNIGERASSKYIFGENVALVESLSRQYLLTRVGGLNLNRALLYAFGKPGSSVAYFIPPEWRKIIRNHGVKVAPFRTALLWQTFIGMMLAYGFLRIVRIIFEGIMVEKDQPNRRLGRYVYFDGLVSGNLPQSCRDGVSYDIINWYIQWVGRISDIDTICHGVIGTDMRSVRGTPVIQIPEPILPLKSLGSLFRYLIWGLVASLLTIWELLRGRWWHALLLNQAALATKIRLQDPKKIAKEYLFHNVNWVYRPMWTYEAERRGSRVTFYFYSSNTEEFKQTEGYPPLIYGYQAMTWPHYLVWDEYQADFVRRAVGEKANISVVGSIWFHDSVEEMPTLRGRGVAVFDVTPYRDVIYRSLGLDFDYYIPKTSIAFLRDIQKVTNNAGYIMMWKRKRKIGSRAHPRYQFFEEHLRMSENVIIVDPDISANRVIEASTAVISMPFTATALVARELGKPSCYYDPTGLVLKDDRAAHGIDVIKGPKELMYWFSVNWSNAISK